MNVKSQYLESGIMSHIFMTDTFSKPSTIAIALTTDIPTSSQTGSTINELPNSNGYARFDLGAPADADWAYDYINGSGHLDSAVEISFTASGGDWGYVSGVAILDSASHGAGNLLYYKGIDTPKIITDGDSYTLPVGSLDIYHG